MDGVGIFMVVIIGIAMLIGLFKMINQERAENDNKPLGCVASVVIIIVVILFWILTSSI